MGAILAAIIYRAPANALELFDNQRQNQKLDPCFMGIIARHQASFLVIEFTRLSSVLLVSLWG